MNFKQQLETRPLYWALIFALAGFGAGFGAFEGILRVAQLERIGKDRLAALERAERERNTLAQKLVACQQATSEFEVERNPKFLDLVAKNKALSNSLETKTRELEAKTQALEEARHQISKLTQKETDMTAIQSLSDIIGERNTRSDMLAASIRRRAPLEELKERKRQYDVVFVRWNSTYQSKLLAILRMGPRFSNFEAYLNQGLSPTFKGLDKCLTSAYDVRIKTASAERSINTLIECDALHRRNSAHDCSDEITGGLFKLVNSERQDADLIAEIDQRIKEKCKVNS